VHIHGISKGNLVFFYNRSEGKVFVARDGVFLEKEFPKREKCRQKVYLEEVQDEPLRKDFISDANVAERVEMPVAREAPPQPRRSERACRATDKLNLMITGERDILLLDNDEPMTYAEAMMDPDSEKWQSAMRSVLGGFGIKPFTHQKQKSVLIVQILVRRTQRQNL
jgi:hypothetical protein